MASWRVNASSINAGQHGLLACVRAFMEFLVSEIPKVLGMVSWRVNAYGINAGPTRIAPFREGLYGFPGQ